MFWNLYFYEGTNFAVTPLRQSKNLMKHLISLISLLIISSLSYGQDAVFKSYSITEGLSQSVINALYQDADGFLWVGTQDGVNRFDGQNFRKFIRNPLETNSISNNWIYSITGDKNGNIWVGTRFGLNCYNRKTDKFIAINQKGNKKKQIAGDFVYGLATDKQGNIVANTPPYLNIVDVNTLQVKSYKNQLEGSTAVEDQQIPVIVDNQGLIWAGSPNGLACFDPASKKFTNYHASNSGLQNNSVTSLFQDKSGKIWVGTKGGLFCFDKSVNFFTDWTRGGKNTLTNEIIRAMVQDKSGNYWIATQNGLHMMRFSPNGQPFWEMYNNHTGQHGCISQDIVFALCIDKSDNLWVGTLTALDRTNLKKPKFRLYQKSNSVNSVNLLDNPIGSIYKAKDGIIWVGNWGKGLNLFDRKTGKVEHFSSGQKGRNFIPNDFIHQIVEDSQGRIWLGTADGIFMWVAQSRSFVAIQQYFKTTNIPTFRGNRIYCILEDFRHHVWVGTRNGLFEINLENLSCTSYKAGSNQAKNLSDNLIYALIESKEKKLWIGTSAGLDVFNPETKSFSHFYHNVHSTNSLCDNFIVSLCEDYIGNIWIGTKSGINTYSPKDKKFKYYSENDGLPSNIVYEIQEDKNHNLWFGTGRGLVRYQAGKPGFRVYGPEDNLQSLEFNLKASYKSPDGEIFFGGMNGFNSFHPDSLHDNPNVPNVVITSITRENARGKQTENLCNKDEIVLEYDDFAFTLEFAALEFTNPEKNYSAYKLEGSAEKWIEIGKRKFVPFSNLAWGNYIFHVKACNNDGTWNNTGAKIKIRVNPPWWASKWAYTFYFLLIITLIYLFIRLREKKLIYDKKILEHKVAERTFEIEQQKEEILTQRDEIQAQRDIAETQRDKIARQNKSITDSIVYAKRIQKALLPSDDAINEHFAEHFVFFQPKDIVSGDYYLVKKIGSKLVIAVADCTGHGVPGAFMSLLGMSLLNEILRHSEVTTAGAALEKLRKQVKTSFENTSRRGEPQDGMDIALVVIDMQTNRLQYSGVNNPLILFRNGEMSQMQPVRNPFGIYLSEDSFPNKELQLEPGDVFYLFSDGFYSQFGGKNGRKYMQRNFKDLLMKIHPLAMNKQKSTLEREFNLWRSTFEQVDDVLVMGIKVR
jgi:ligand-binding sensor domain-containing protein/serine phosphatase RsbU (regulator of sigma subunit)